MKFNQKKWSNYTNFKLEDDYFEYQHKDEDGRIKKKFDYLMLPSKDDFYEIVDKNMFFIIFSIAFLIVGVAIYFIFLVWKDQTKLSMITLSIISYILYRNTEIAYTAIPTENGSVCVIKDKFHDDIIDELYSRRNNLLKKDYGKIDFENSLENEIAKFEYLLNENVISSDEFNTIEAKLYSHNNLTKTHGNETLQ